MTHAAVRQQAARPLFTAGRGVLSRSPRDSLAPGVIRLPSVSSHGPRVIRRPPRDSLPP